MNDKNHQTEQTFGMLENYPDVLCVDDVCQILRIGRKSVYRLLHNGEMEYVRIGRIYRISKESVARYLKIK